MEFMYIHGSLKGWQTSLENCSTTLNKTQLAKEGQLSEASVGYTFLWIGHSAYEYHEADSGFAIKFKLASSVSGPLKGVNDHPMKVLLPFTTNPDHVKERSYRDLKL